MKKVFVFCMMLLLSMSLCFSASADPGWFVSSPSGNPAPEQIGFAPASDDCKATLIVTAYANRDQLSQEDRLAIESAYKDIVTTTDLTALNADLAALAQQKGIQPTDLAVSELFDLSANGCGEDHDEHGPFDITLKPEEVENFVGLLHYSNGTWKIVPHTKIEGGHLIFTVDDLSPFAVVVNTGDAVAEEEEESKVDPLNLLAYCTILAAAALSVIVLWKKSN